MKEYILLLMFFLCLTKSNSQSDSLIINTDQLQKKNWTIPLSEITATNILVNRFDLYALKADWAKVNLNSWLENIKRGFQTDDDKFTTNFFGHPVHGSLYFNAARSLGFNFWQSGIYTIGGSLMWEFLGETLPASEIDINTTVQGGMYLGEITHRLSKDLLRNNKKRSLHFLRNSAALIINPLGKLNQWFYNDVNNSFTTNKDPIALIRSQLSLGISFPIIEFDKIDVLSSVYINYALLYGDIFKESKTFKPFDSFVLKSWVDITAFNDLEKVYLNITSHAYWLKKEIGKNNIISISQHYDYLNNQAFKIGVTGISGDYTFKKLYSNWGIIGSINIGIIPFGSSSSDVLKILDLGEIELNAEYIYGRGYLGKFECMVFHNKTGRITFSFNHWYINTENFVQGTERTSLIQFKYYYPYTEFINIGFELYSYRRIASYKEIPDYVNKRENYEEIKLFVAKFF